ncbi:MAG: ABC transporter six-transmembrane domain-containing protein [Chloroflexota bacterium]
MTIQTTSTPAFSLGILLRRFRGKIALTLLLVILEAATTLLFPLFMGFAINDLLNATYDGLFALGALGVASLIIGALRRVYDTRAYASIYTTVVSELVEKEQQKDSSVSKISARANLFTELVEFLENSFPQIVNSLIGLVGTLLIIASLNIPIFVACLITSIFVLIVYGLSGRRNFKLNKGYNDELERQVDVLGSSDQVQIATHFKQVMRWNIKLSDFETFNFSLVWVAMITLLLYAIYAAVNSGLNAYGTIFALVVYVFEYIESVVTLPLYFQQLIRLNEISTRLND